MEVCYLVLKSGGSTLRKLRLEWPQIFFICHFFFLIFIIACLDEGLAVHVAVLIQFDLSDALNFYCAARAL